MSSDLFRLDLRLPGADMAETLLGTLASRSADAPIARTRLGDEQAGNQRPLRRPGQRHPLPDRHPGHQRTDSPGDHSEQITGSGPGRTYAGASSTQQRAPSRHIHETALP